jgi:hypothetical protein
VVDLELGERVVKALAPPTVKLEPDQIVKLRFDPKRLHVFTEEGDAIVSAAGEDVFTVADR